MSNWVNLCVCLLSILLNQLITSLLLFHCRMCVAFLILLLMVFKICLLIKPIWDLAGFINLHLGVEVKCSLWSFIVMNAWRLASVSSLLSNLRFLALCFASWFIWLYVFVFVLV